MVGAGINRSGEPLKSKRRKHERVRNTMVSSGKSIRIGSGKRAVQSRRTGREMEKEICSFFCTNLDCDNYEFNNGDIHVVVTYGVSTPHPNFLIRLWQRITNSKNPEKITGSGLWDNSYASPYLTGDETDTSTCADSTSTNIHLLRCP